MSQPCLHHPTPSDPTKHNPPPTSPTPLLLQALCSAACFAPEDWPLLIVCPSTMKLVWRDALYDWLPQELHPEPHNLLVVKDGKASHAHRGMCDTDWVAFHMGG